MSPLPEGVTEIRVGAPRVSGDEPQRISRVLEVVRCSPRERG